MCRCGHREPDGDFVLTIQRKLVRHMEPPRVRGKPVEVSSCLVRLESTVVRPPTGRRPTAAG